MRLPLGLSVSPSLRLSMVRFGLRLLAALLVSAPAHAWNSSMVQVDAQGRLTFPADASGNRIPDFSHAGYKGGGVPLPTDIPVVRTLAHATGDQTARIQAALDEVAALPLQPNGYRGTLQLAAGTWEVLGTIRLRTDGIVLAGMGNGDDPASNTILRRTGTSQAAIIQAGTRNDAFRSEIPTTRSQITTDRVQVGARSFEVDQPTLYRVGDPVIIFHPSTQAWLDAVNRGGVTDNNYWRPGEIDIRYHRYITAISGSTITVDAPVFNHLDRALSQSVLFKYDAAHVIRRVGIEKLQVDIITKGELTEEHAEDAITFVGTEDSWIRDSTMKHFWHAGVQWEGSTRGTAERCRAVEPHSIVTGARRYNFSMYQAQLILVRDSFADRARHAYVCNGTSLDSGIVFLNCISDRALTSSEGHRRWSTGLLYDSLVATNRQTTDILGLYNRGTYGTGHGWAAAHSVAWNCNASTGGRIWIQRPPTAQNYGIGCTGNVTGTGPFAGPAGHIEGTNQAGLEPRSLYLAQLAQRLADAEPRI
ncbi:MAG TPA: peptidoglycan-binding protein, partial [Opitutaceae bacterium]